MAKEIGAEIFSADSRQIYKELSIGTAKPTSPEMQGIPHHLIDYISIHKKYTVGDYEKKVISLLEEYFKSNDIAILCGGTGLYIDAIINGLDEFPTISSEIGDQVQSDLEKNGLKLLQDELRLKDPAYHDSIDLQNPRRVTRAVEVIRQSGQTFTSFLNKPKPKRNFTIDPYVLLRDRSTLYDRINKRVDQMLADGLLDEVRPLYPFKHLRSLNTVGYSEIFDHLDGKISLDRAVELIKQNSRRYAKRQMTWFRRKEAWHTINLD